MSQIIELSLKVDPPARQELADKFVQIIAHVQDSIDSQDRAQFYHFALGMIDTCTVLHAHLLPHGVIQALEDANESAMARLELGEK
ncbi:hypothetical protein ACU684_19595 [Pseudomonas sp. LF135]